MKISKNSILKLGKRQPYQPITRVFDLPPAILEMATLIELGIAGDHKALKSRLVARVDHHGLPRKSDCRATTSEHDFERL